MARSWSWLLPVPLRTFPTALLLSSPVIRRMLKVVPFTDCPMKTVGLLAGPAIRGRQSTAAGTVNGLPFASVTGPDQVTVALGAVPVTLPTHKRQGWPLA